MNLNDSLSGSRVKCPNCGLIHQCEAVSPSRTQAKKPTRRERSEPVGFRGRWFVAASIMVVLGLIVPVPSYVHALSVRSECDKEAREIHAEFKEIEKKKKEEMQKKMGIVNGKMMNPGVGNPLFAMALMAAPNGKGSHEPSPEQVQLAERETRLKEMNVAVRDAYFWFNCILATCIVLFVVGVGLMLWSSAPVLASVKVA